VVTVKGRVIAKNVREKGNIPSAALSGDQPASDVMELEFVQGVVVVAGHRILCKNSRKRSM